MRQWRDDALAGRPALAIVNNEVLLDLQRRGVPLRVVAGDVRRIVIANR